jgi:hypothetical protein
VALLTKDQILNANDVKTEEVNVPEWGGSVLVTTISAAERDAFEQSITDAKGKVGGANVRAKFAAKCVVGEDGKRLFSDAEVLALGKKSGAALNRIFEAASRLNGMTKADTEELAGNSSAVPAGDSHSA